MRILRTISGLGALAACGAVLWFLVDYRVAGGSFSQQVAPQLRSYWTRPPQRVFLALPAGAALTAGDPIFVTDQAGQFTQVGVVRLVSGPGEVGVRVEDRGPGMDEETQRRLFERFYRAESAAPIAGTGLGMSIVKEILDIHGSRIEIDSAPGRGTAVTLWLPQVSPRG